VKLEQHMSVISLVILQLTIMLNHPRIDFVITWDDLQYNQVENIFFSTPLLNFFILQFYSYSSTEFFSRNPFFLLPSFIPVIPTSQLNLS
jgi:hypothetical protein